MAFDISTRTSGAIVEISLSGELDASTAPRFRLELEAAALAKPTTLVLHARELVYIASAGIRMLIFAKQKMGAAVTMYVVAPQQQILETLERTGVKNSVVVVDQYPVAS